MGEEVRAGPLRTARDTDVGRRTAPAEGLAPLVIDGLQSVCGVHERHVTWTSARVPVDPAS
jgi:hypothetical protein